MKQRLIKYTLAVLALVVSGEAYLVLEELKQLRNNVQIAEMALNASANAFSDLYKSSQRLRSDVGSLARTATNTREQCNKASGEAKKVIKEVKGLREDVKKVLKKLRI